MTSNWPTAPLIRVLDGEVNEVGVADDLAYRAGDSAYVLITGEHTNETIACGFYGDLIVDWEEVVAVPTAALKRLRDERGRKTSLHNLCAAIDDVLECLPADKSSALDRAVTRVKDVTGTPMVDAETLPADRLSLLLDALASVQSAARKSIPLAMVARICVDWADVEEPHCDALREIAGRAESDPNRIDFVGLASFVGDVATSLDDGTNGGPRNDLLEMGHYALARAAQIIEEEDK